MTNKEAVDILKNLMCPPMRADGKSITHMLVNVAIETAIKSLEQQKVGKWVCLRDQYDDIVDAVCSKCDAHGYDKWKFCPDCGAKMEEE